MLDYLCYSPIDSVIPNLPKQGPVSFVRVVNLYSKMKKIDVAVNGHRIFKEFGFRRFSSYIVLPPGQCKINVYPSGKDSPLLAGLVTEFKPDCIYTVAVYIKEDAEILCISDINDCHNAEESNIRLVHLDKNTQEIDLSYMNGTKLLEQIKYKDISQYVNLPPGKHSFKGLNSNTGKLIFILQNIQLDRSWNYTIYIPELPGKNNPVPLLLIDGSTYISKK